MTRAIRFFSSSLLIFVVFQSLQSVQAQNPLLLGAQASINYSYSPPQPFVTLNGYAPTFYQNGNTYNMVGVVINNYHSNYNVILSPQSTSAGAPGTTFGYGANTFNQLGDFTTWTATIPLPAQISTSPASPTYFTLTFYIVDAAGGVYNGYSYATYSFLTYNTGGTVITSPVGGPYYEIAINYGAEVVSKSGAIDSTQVPNSTAPRTRAKVKNFPAPPVNSLNNSNIEGSWENRPSSLILAGPPSDRAGSNRVQSLLRESLFSIFRRDEVGSLSTIAIS